jgi:coniferyl-aldehyde dehydrogenase
MNPLLYDLEQNKLVFRQEPNPSLEKRRERISRLITMLNENEENLFKVIEADFGFRQPVETQIAEFTGIRQEAAFTLKNLQKWIKPIGKKTPLHLKPSRSYLIPQAKGVVGIMSPWNYPLSLALIPVIAAFAAGNRVWLKPSERTPRTSGHLAILVAQYFHPTEFTVITGGPETSNHFANLPFDHLFFTGSTEKGQLVAKAAAENLTPTTLELGGKSPCVIDPSASLKECASRILYGKIFNGGQTCIAPDYILVPNNLREALIAQLQESFSQMYSDHSLVTHPIDVKQFERYQLIVQDAVTKGAIVIPLGTDDWTAPAFQPLLVLEANSTTRVMNEEIFGPILPIIGYDSASEVIEFINARPRPLALYWFGSNRNRLKEILLNTQSGGVTVNDTLLHFANHYLPFGGVGMSGMGAYHGKYGFDTFTHFKAVLQMRSWFGMSSLSGTKLLHPPFTNSTRRVMKFLEKL